jgi:hypothetical protein
MKQHWHTVHVPTQATDVLNENDRIIGDEVVEKEEEKKGGFSGPVFTRTFSIILLCRNCTYILTKDHYVTFCVPLHVTCDAQIYIVC